MTGDSETFPDPSDPPLRPATRDDIGEIARLWCDAFPGKRTEEDRIRMMEVGGRYGGLETVLTVRGPGGRLAGACKIYRLRQHLAGTWLPMMGLAAVAVAPPFRRQGLGAGMCTGAIHEAVARGDVVSVLYPFRPDYYETLGWGLVGRLLRHRCRTEWLPEWYDADGVRTASASDAGALIECYGRIAARSNGPIERDERAWAYRLTGEELGVRPIDLEAVWEHGSDPGCRVFIHETDGRVTGYALVRFRRARRREDHALQVQELVAESEPAYRALLGHLRSHHEEWPLLRHAARPEERFEDRLLDPRPDGHRSGPSLYFPTARLVRGPMLRVLDVPEALRRRGWFVGSPGQAEDLLVRLAVQDRQRPENRGPWDVHVPAERGEKAVVGPARASQRAIDVELRTSASTFARIFAGELTVRDAVRIGRAEASGAAGLLTDAMSAREEFWLLDEF